jgi:acetyl/propionyl-CoA carboxylase alpha subunit
MENSENLHYVAHCNESDISISESDLLNQQITMIDSETIHLNYKNTNYTFKILKLSSEQMEVDLKIGKRKKTIKIEAPLQQLIRSLGYESKKSKYNDSMLAPMPGLVLDIRVKEGDQVKKGDHLVTLEAMKMENILKAAHDGVIKKLYIQITDKVEKNQLLLQFDQHV